MKISIDFSGLEKLNKTPFIGKYLWGGIGIFLTLLFLEALLHKPFGDQSSVFYIIFLVVIGIYDQRVLFRKRADNVATYKEWALRNSLSYSPEVRNFDKGPGSLFSHYELHQVQHVIGGAIGAFPFTLFQYTGGNRGQKFSYYVTVLRVDLPRTLPHMVIDSHAETIGGSALPLKFNESQRIELEGDFFHHYSAYAPKGYESLLHNILSPDVMRVLVANGAKCDIEIIDNRLYFYWPYHVTQRAEYEATFMTTHAVIAEVSRKLTTGDIYTKPEHQVLHDIQGRGQVLRKSSGVFDGVSIAVKVAAGLTALFVLAVSRGPIDDRILGAFVWGVLVGALVFAIESLWRHRRANKNVR